MDKQLDLKDIVLLGRTFDEYCRMFDLNNELLNKGNILDVASGVSSFCAEANKRGCDVTASDIIYASSAAEIEKKCANDLDSVMEQLPDIYDLYIWNYFRDIRSLKIQREKAYRTFIEDYREHGIRRYRYVAYPVTDFYKDQFTLSLVSHFLFLYEEKLDYDFHKKTILELLRITSKELRIFPIVNLKGNRSVFVKRVIHDDDMGNLQISLRKVDYEFMRNGNEVMVIEK